MLCFECSAFLTQTNKGLSFDDGLAKLPGWITKDSGALQHFQEDEVAKIRGGRL
jgi:hypothetical protein